MKDIHLIQTKLNLNLILLHRLILKYTCKQIKKTIFKVIIL